MLKSKNLKTQRLVMSSNSALLVVDMQNDFMPWGALPVPKSSEIIPLINEALISPRFALKIASKDAHPKDHVSFENNGVSGWPVHCVENSQGFEFPSLLKKEKFDFVIRKGRLKESDSYSAFYNAPGQQTELLDRLNEKQISDLFICGIALEYCVKETVLDALRNKFNVFVLKDLIRPIFEEETAKIHKKLESKGAVIL
ncbi:isochorismatase family protein [Acetobacteraceae bacterium]|nr:isochorismatase family protein [Acetobacteraceae bacterium]